MNRVARFVFTASLLAIPSLARAQYPALPSPSTVVGSLSANPYALPAPVYPLYPPITSPLPTWTPTPTYPNLGVVGRDGQYLGNLNNNRFDPNSIANPYGRYGSPYSPDSVTNPYGRYGSPYSPESATNPYAVTPPLIIRR